MATRLVCQISIIYDNSCKLHQYILNRQPSHFKNTPFLVDRFHWRGHVGCSSGYSLDRYATPQISSINSQVNEQANAGLQRTKGQIAYMKPDNFMFHILGITDMDKKRENRYRKVIFVTLVLTFPFLVHYQITLNFTLTRFSCMYTVIL